MFSSSTRSSRTSDQQVSRTSSSFSSSSRYPFDASCNCTSSRFLSERATQAGSNSSSGKYSRCTSSSRTSYQVAATVFPFEASAFIRSELYEQQQRHIYQLDKKQSHERPGNCTSKSLTSISFTSSCRFPFEASLASLTSSNSTSSSH
jgi:hypothetical protein